MYRDDEGSVGPGPPTGAFQGQRDQRLSLKTFILGVQGSCDIITSMDIGQKTQALGDRVSNEAHVLQPLQRPWALTNEKLLGWDNHVFSTFLVLVKISDSVTFINFFFAHNYDVNSASSVFMLSFLIIGLCPPCSLGLYPILFRQI